MRDLEPQLLAILTMEAKPTTQIIEELGKEYVTRDRARTQVHEALRCLEADGTIESRMCYIGNPIRYWSLPGGTFPKGVTDSRPLTDRIMDVLDEGPQKTDHIFKAVFSEAEATNTHNAERRLGKALHRLKDRGLVERCADENGLWMPATWRRT